jgi:3-hydroxyisobutyrate dehydrogenase
MKMTSLPQKIGFIGLGTMGGPISLNLARANYSLVVHDLRRSAAKPIVDAGALWANDVKEVATAADVVFTSLPRPDDVNSIADDLINNMKSGAIWIDLTTNSPTLIRQLHQRCATKGISLLDAPVSGGPRGARSGQLAVWVGGERNVFDSALKILSVIGDQVLYIGPIGTGLVAKLVNNAAHYTIQTALAEIFSIGVKGGVAPLSLWSALRQGSSGRMRTFARLGRHFLRGVFEPPDFALNLAHKDIRLATELARDLGIPSRITELTYAEMTEALNRGWGDRDSRVAMLLQEERAGIIIQESDEEIQAVLARDS